MRAFYKTFLYSSAFFGVFYAYTQMIANSRFLTGENMILRLAAAQGEDSNQRLNTLKNQAAERSGEYENQLEQGNLADGMVVNVDAKGKIHDECDSLLFSSLRYVALLKLGHPEKAAKAWASIVKSQEDGLWLRHPRCSKSTSRDMILGLLVALSQDPKDAAGQLKLLMAQVDQHGGFFGTGPIYVSYLSPGLARFIAMLAPKMHVPGEDLPEIIQLGYSTAEIEVMVTNQGFESHLGALTAWLEMEMIAQDASLAESVGWIARLSEFIVAPFTKTDLHLQRLAWITEKLVERDPDNLFYRYLRLREAGALTPKVRSDLLSELLSMPHFPRDRLPMDCDRSADYLWQRVDRDVNVAPIACSRQFNGTDFLWMAALLSEEPRSPRSFAR